ncbi:MAG: hypothetical protein AB4041_14590 [Microcystaceae cyanobacterium]
MTLTVYNALISFINPVNLDIIPHCFWIVSGVGIIGMVVNVLMLVKKINHPLTLEPEIYLRQSPNDDPLYQSFLSIEKQPIEEAYKICFNHYQDILINNYLPKIFFCFALTIVPIICIVSEWTITNEWNDSWIILTGCMVLPISWGIAFTTRIYSFIVYGLLLSWAIYAISLSGHSLLPDTLLLFALIIYFINLSAVIIIENQQKENKNSSITGMIAWSIFVIFILSLLRYLLPLIGSFTILLVIPAILITCRLNGCLGSFLAIPLLIISAIMEQYVIVFPNSLLVASFFSFDTAFLFLILINPEQIKHVLHQLLQQFNIAHPNNIPFPCQRCGSGMEYIEHSEIDNYLSEPQQIAHSLDSMHYLAWHCPQCYPSKSVIHLRGYIERRKRYPSENWFEDCPTCHERTMICHKTFTTESTSHFAGITIHNKTFNIERTCPCCNLTDSHEAHEHRMD